VLALAQGARRLLADKEGEVLGGTREQDKVLGAVLLGEGVDRHGTLQWLRALQVRQELGAATRAPGAQEHGDGSATEEPAWSGQHNARLYQRQGELRSRERPILGCSPSPAARRTPAAAPPCPTLTDGRRALSNHPTLAGS